MKKLILAVVCALSLYGCGGSEYPASSGSPVTKNGDTIINYKFILKNKFKGLTLTTPAQSYDAWHGKYDVTVMVHNTGFIGDFDTVNINAKCYNDDGEKTGEFDVSPPDNILKGDSTLTTLPFIFPDKSHLPVLVIISDGGI